MENVITPRFVKGAPIRLLNEFIEIYLPLLYLE